MTYRACVHLLICFLAGLAVAEDAVPVSSIRTVHAERTPAVAKGNLLVIRNLYAASLNPRTRQADWVCYVVQRELMGGGNVISRNWHTEFHDFCLESSDYHRANEYDRGHCAPLNSFDRSPHAHELNDMANIVIQRLELNRGPWLRLEEHERELALRYGRVEVTVRTLYRHKIPADPDDDPPLPHADEPYRVPSHFTKVLRYKAEGREVTRGFLFPQRVDRNQDYQEFEVDPKGFKNQ